MGSNEDNNSLHRFNESDDQIFISEKQYKQNVSEFETKISDLMRCVIICLLYHYKIHQSITTFFCFFHSENDLLKHQLRKYVSAVQLMKQDENESEEVKLYQQKLVQVCNNLLFKFSSASEKIMKTTNSLGCRNAQ